MLTATLQRLNPTPTSNESPGYDTKQPSVKLQFWSFEECGVPFIAITLRSTLRNESTSQGPIYRSNHHHHHHHVVPQKRISLTLSRHFSLWFIASGKSSGLYPVSSHSCCMHVRAVRPAFARPYVGVHRSISLMSSSLLFQQCPACLVRLTWIVFLMRRSNRTI